jgi:hypothetical protein
MARRHCAVSPSQHHCNTAVRVRRCTPGAELAPALALEAENHGTELNEIRFRG